MKIKMLLTKTEKDETTDLMACDPCTAIECRGISCEDCPLHNVAENVRDAHRAFINVLQKLTVEGE